MTVEKGISFRRKNMVQLKTGKWKEKKLNSCNVDKKYSITHCGP